MSPRSQRIQDAAPKTVKMPRDGNFTREFVLEVFAAQAPQNRPVHVPTVNRFWRTFVTTCNRLKVLDEKCESCSAQAGTCEHGNWGKWADSRAISIKLVEVQKEVLLDEIDQWAGPYFKRLLTGLGLVRQGKLKAQAPATRSKRPPKIAFSESKRPYDVSICVEGIVAAKVRMVLTPGLVREAEAAKPTDPAYERIKWQLIHNKQYAMEVTQELKLV